MDVSKAREYSGTPFALCQPMRSPVVRPGSIVLIIESDPATRGVLTRAIELEGGTAIVASSALDAYAVLAEHVNRITLLVLGITGNSGDAVAVRHLQLDAPRVAAIPAVVVSDRPLTDDECAQLRPTAVVVKPLHIEDVRNILSLLDAHRSSGLAAPRPLAVKGGLSSYLFH
jgi:DNA-binding response OmpR family regulator